MEAVKKVKEDFPELKAAPEGASGQSNTMPQLEDAKEAAKLAAKEVRGGFPLLHEQAVISLWGWTENAVAAFLAAWLENNPSAWNVPEVARLRVRIGEYEELDRQERCLYIVELLERELGGPSRHGVNRFENLLKPFKLDGRVPKIVGRGFLELHQIRNVLVHRNGAADRRMVEACPWLRVKIGAPIIVKHRQFVRYCLAAIKYVTVIKNRLRKLHLSRVASGG